MNKEVYNWMKQWSDLVNKETPQEDFWIETPVGSFKNPKFIPEESGFDNEINITIKYDEWDKTIEVMNKEQIIDEAYVNYKGSRECQWTPTYFPTPYTKEEFINKCKTDSEFSEKWGLKIEERELSTQERNEWFQIHLNGNNPFMKSDWKDFELDQQNIPTKLITITYNNETIESYE